MPKIPIVLTLFLGLVISCNDKKEDSPYSDILGLPPFSSLTDSIRHDRKNDGLYFRRAVLLNSNNLPEPALADFQKAWSLQKKEPYALGISTLLLNKKPDSAILFLQQALKEIPNSLMLRLSLAHSYHAQKKIDEALLICNEILHYIPVQVDVLKLKGDLLWEKGNKDEAIAMLEKARQITPFDVELNYFLAFKYTEQKNPGVLALCDSLIRYDSLDLRAEPYYYKGLYYSNINDKEKALTQFDLAIKKDYTFLEGYIEKAAVLYDQKKYPAAIKVLDLSLTISPSFADGYYWLGKVNEAMGNKEAANLDYRKAYQLDKTMTEAKQAIERMK